MNRKRAKSLTDTYDIPRNTIIDLYAAPPKITPHDIAIYSLVQKKPFNTFPSRKNVVRKQSLEHIYDEIPLDFDKPAGGKPKSVDITSLRPAKINAPKTDEIVASKTAENEGRHATEKVYENHDSIEKTKL